MHALPGARRLQPHIATQPSFTTPSIVEMMNTEKTKFEFTPRHQAYIALLAWGVITLLLVRRDVYGLDEFAARGMAQSWAIASSLSTSAFYFGMPDLRALLFLPLGFLWPGKVFVAKVLTTGVLAITARLLYLWRRTSAGPEAALLPTALLLVSPLALAQIDSVSTGVYLLAAFAVGGWLEQKFRANPRPFNGWFFSLLFMSAFSTSLHPAGLAFPLALLASSRTLPLTAKYRNYLIAGIIFCTVLLLAMRFGWGDLAWLHNPVFALSAAFTGVAVNKDFSLSAQWLPGLALGAITLLVIGARWRTAWPDVVGRSMIIGLVIGTFVGDDAWAMLALAFTLYYGIPVLQPRGQDAPQGGTMKQRNALLAAVFACTTIFMLADKVYYGEAHRGALSAQDKLIKTLADEFKAADARDDGNPRFVVASEWPGRTMIACMCDTLPLPPVIPGQPEKQLGKLHGVNYLMFDPKETANIELARNFSLLGGAVETVALQDGGAILEFKQEKTSQPAAKPEGTEAK
jgi:hypothetical protein